MGSTAVKNVGLRLKKNDLCVITPTQVANGSTHGTNHAGFKKVLETHYIAFLPPMCSLSYHFFIGSCEKVDRS